MHKNILSLLLIVCTIFSVGRINAQTKSSKTIVLNGRLTDANTGEPIPFANIGVLNTYTGAASNEDGFFELKISEKYKQNKVQISAIGYHTLNISIAQMTENAFNDIKLSSSTYKLKGVEVMGESRLQHTRIRKAIDRIANNYLQLPFNYDFFYRSKQNVDGKEKLYEAAAKLYDKTGYKRANSLKAFEERNYSFLQTRKNFSTHTFSDAQHWVDDVLDMDIVRTTNNILNKEYLHNYDIDLDAITEFEGDTVWVIKYKSKKPTLATTGDYYAKSYSGKLYIKKKDFAIVKNEMHIEAKNFSPHGRSYFVDTETQNQSPVSISYDVVTVYKQHLEFYYLHYINYKRKHEWEDKTTKQPYNENIFVEILITDVKTFNPDVLTSRMYYENMTYNENFWKSYNIIPSRK